MTDGHGRVVPKSSSAFAHYGPCGWNSFTGLRRYCTRSVGGRLHRAVAWSSAGKERIRYVATRHYEPQDSGLLAEEKTVDRQVYASKHRKSRPGRNVVN